MLYGSGDTYGSGTYGSELVVATIRFKRGTLAEIDAAAGASGLIQGEPYAITDTDQVAIGTSTTTYEIVGPLTPADIGAATAAQGTLADSATQPGDLGTVATSNDYDDLDNLPTLGTAAAAATGDFESSGAVATHEADTTAVHGIADTSVLVVESDLGTAAAQDIGDFEAAGSVSSHESDTTSIHGIADTSVLVVDSDLGTSAALDVGTGSGDVAAGNAPAAAQSAAEATAAGALSSHESDTTSIHGIADTSDLIIGDGSITAMKKMTAAAFAGITPDANTFYAIVG